MSAKSFDHLKTVQADSLPRIRIPGGEEDARGSIQSTSNSKSEYSKVSARTLFCYGVMRLSLKFRNFFGFRKERKINLRIRCFPLEISAAFLKFPSVTLIDLLFVSGWTFLEWHDSSLLVQLFVSVSDSSAKTQSQKCRAHYAVWYHFSDFYSLRNFKICRISEDMKHFCNQF